MAGKQFKAISHTGPIPDITRSFSISCPPKTDIWNKPPSTHSFNAPIIYQSLDIASFKSAQVTVSADWKEKYDQGGLCLIIDPHLNKQRWVKTGVEFLNGQPHVSTVATNGWSDWSLRPISSSSSKSTTVQIKKEEDGSLWVYLMNEDDEMNPMREVTWWGEIEESTQIWVGVYAAKPAAEESSLFVHFDRLSIDAA